MLNCSSLYYFLIEGFTVWSSLLGDIYLLNEFSTIIFPIAYVTPYSLLAYRVLGFCSELI